MKLLKIPILLTFLLVVFQPAEAQLLTNTAGQNITLSHGAVMTVPSSMTNLGTVTNNGGFIYVSGDWINSGIYAEGTGHFIFNGSTVQTINHGGQKFYVLTIDGGGKKLLTSDITVVDSVMLANGIVDLSTNTHNMILEAGGHIEGGSATSFIDGPLTQTGTGDLNYPIGKNGTFIPAALLDVQGTNPRIKLEVFNSSPLAVADSGLTVVSDVRYWQRTIESGTFDRSRVKISLVNETNVSPISKTVISAGTATSTDFKNYGRTNPSGTTADGSLESSRFLDNTLNVFAAGQELNENRVADSLALIAIYQELGGANWTNSTNWNTNTPINQWFGVTVTNERVTGLSLSGNNLSGSMGDAIRLLTELTNLDLSNNEISGAISSAFIELAKLTSANLSNNKLDELGDLTGLTAITSLDVSGNMLAFGTIVPNIGVTGIKLSPQDTIGEVSTVSKKEKEDVTLSVTTDHPDDVYQWYKNGNVLTGFTSSSITLTNVGFDDLGKYNCKITNSNISGLELTTADQVLQVFTDLSGTVKLAKDNTTPFSAGEIILFKDGSFGFDTVQVKVLGTDGTFLFEEVILGDYFLKVVPDGTDSSFMSTYYESTIVSNDATPVVLRTATNDIAVLELQRPEPFKPEEGNNAIEGFFEIEERFLQNARIQARRRVRLAGVSLYRSKSRNRTFATEEDGIDLTNWDLVAYTQTDDDGEFKFNNVPDGNYRIIIDYPGIPISSGSEIDFMLSEANDQSEIVFEAAIDDPEEGIVIKEKSVLHTRFDLIESLSVYPNPAGDYLTVALDSRKDYKVKLSIVDIKGLEVFNKMISRNETIDNQVVIDVSKIQPGVYTVILNDPTGDEAPLKYAKLMVTR